MSYRGISEICSYRRRNPALEPRIKEVVPLIIKKENVLDGLVLFNEITETYLNEWFISPVFVKYVNRIQGAGSINEVLNHLIEVLDVLLLVKEIDDWTEWQTQHEIEHTKAIRKIEDNFHLQDTALEEIHDPESNWLLNKSFERMGDVSEAIINTHFKLNETYKGKGGRTSGESSKRGWAVKFLGSIIPDKVDEKPSTIANLLTQLSGFKTTRQQVWSILEKRD